MTQLINIAMAHLQITAWDEHKQMEYECEDSHTKPVSSGELSETMTLQQKQTYGKGDVQERGMGRQLSGQRTADQKAKNKAWRAER